MGQGKEVVEERKVLRKKMRRDEEVRKEDSMRVRSRSLRGLEACKDCGLKFADIDRHQSGLNGCTLKRLKKNRPKSAKCPSSNCAVYYASHGKRLTVPRGKRT